MKRFKELTEELFTEGGEMYPADDMTISELKIACYAAQNILDKLEAGARIQRWQISAIVKAKEELTAVYTSVSADEQDEMDDVEEWLNGDDEEGEYVGFEYPSMYGEETELDEGFKEKIKGVIRREKQKEYPLIQNRRDVAATKAGAAYATGNQKKGDRYMKWRSDNMKKEETDYEVDVEGLPKMFVKANSPAEVKNNLRKVVKNPEMIRGVERVAKATLQKIFRDKAAGKDEVKEEVEMNEALDLRITKVYNKKKATYAVHSPDRKYYKEFDSMEKAKAHHAEKTGK